jgi:hypothetical protein
VIQDANGRTVEIVMAPEWDQVSKIPRIAGRRWHFVTLSGDPLVPPYCVCEVENGVYAGHAGLERTPESRDRNEVLSAIARQLSIDGCSVVEAHNPRRLYLALTVATQHLLGLLPLVERLDKDGEAVEVLRTVVEQARATLKECCR